MAPAGCGLSAGSYAAPRQQLARRIVRWTAWCAWRLAQWRMRFETGPVACQMACSCITSADGSRRARCLARRLTRIGPVWRNVRRIWCLSNGSRDNCLAGKIRYGIRSHTHQRRWACAQAQSYSSWSVLTISRLMPAPRISLNEVITGPSDVEGLSGSTARPFYLSA